MNNKEWILLTYLQILGENFQSFTIKYEICGVLYQNVVIPLIPNVFGHLISSNMLCNTLCPN